MIYICLFMSTFAIVSVLAWHPDSTMLIFNAFLRVGLGLVKILLQLSFDAHTRTVSPMFT